MKLAVLVRPHDPFSLRIYCDNITRELKKKGVQIIPFTETSGFPADYDLMWEPGLAGNRIPHSIFRRNSKPLITTVHGAAPMNVRWQDYFPSPLAAVGGLM